MWPFSISCRLAGHSRSSFHLPTRCFTRRKFASKTLGTFASCIASCIQRLRLTCSSDLAQSRGSWTGGNFLESKKMPLASLESFDDSFDDSLRINNLKPSVSFESTNLFTPSLLCKGRSSLRTSIQDSTAQLLWTIYDRGSELLIPKFVEKKLDQIDQIHVLVLIPYNYIFSHGPWECFCNFLKEFWEVLIALQCSSKGHQSVTWTIHQASLSKKHGLRCLKRQNVKSCRNFHRLYQKAKCLRMIPLCKVDGPMMSAKPCNLRPISCLGQGGRKVHGIITQKTLQQSGRLTSRSWGNTQEVAHAPQTQNPSLVNSDCIFWSFHVHEKLTQRKHLDLFDNKLRFWDI